MICSHCNKKKQDDIYLSCVHCRKIAKKGRNKYNEKFVEWKYCQNIECPDRLK